MDREPASDRFEPSRPTPRWPPQWPAVLALTLLSTSLLAGIFSGCGRSGRGADEQVQAADDAEWAWLRQAKQRLDGKRNQLARTQAAARPDGPASPAPPPAAARDTLEKLEQEVRGQTDELNRRLIDFINAHPAVEGEPLSGRLLEAVRMKSDEDIRLAREHIERGGDYRRALDIYEAALAVDPDNPRLRQELESARARRYMTAERFAQVKEGMTQQEVRAALGQPNLNNVREYPEKGITAWFYTKDAQGGAAAVWFQQQGKGYVVYEVDFDAVGPGREGLRPESYPAAPASPEPSSTGLGTG